MAYPCSKDTICLHASARDSFHISAVPRSLTATCEPTQPHNKLSHWKCSSLGLTRLTQLLGANRSQTCSLGSYRIRRPECPAVIPGKAGEEEEILQLRGTERNGGIRFLGADLVPSFPGCRLQPFHTTRSPGNKTKDLRGSARVASRHGHHHAC